MPRITKPVHFRLYANSSSNSMCNLVPGRGGKGYKHKKLGNGRYTWEEVAADVPWTRVNVKIDKTTCPVCLTKLIRLAKRSLKARLKLTKRTLLQEYRRHATEKQMGAMRRVVGDA